MSDEQLSHEQRILRMMRKTLTNVVRDTTPPPGAMSPLSPTTIEDIKSCLSLIAAREAEVAGSLGLNRNERPRFTDEPKSAEVIPLHKTGLTKKT